MTPRAAAPAAPPRSGRPDPAGRRAAFDGARAMVPLAVGVMPLALAIGAAIGASSVPGPTGWTGAPLIFAGAAHLTAIRMLDAGAAPVLIVLSALSLNARLVMYGTALAPWFRGATLARRLLLAAPLIDPVFAVVVPRFEQRDLGLRERQAYYLGAATLLAVVWLGTQAVALTIGASLPDGLGFDVAAPLAFAGLLAKSTADRAAAVCAGVAAAVVTAGAGLPFQSAVLIGSLAGVAAGSLAPRRSAS